VAASTSSWEITAVERSNVVARIGGGGQSNEIA
jgi:hypothetical protein